MHGAAPFILPNAGFTGRTKRAIYSFRADTGTPRATWVTDVSSGLARSFRHPRRLRLVLGPYRDCVAKGMTAVVVTSFGPGKLTRAGSRDLDLAARPHVS